MEREIKNGKSKVPTSQLVEWLENLKSEDVKKRTEAVSHLKQIALAFGPKKTREVLLPFLNGKFSKCSECVAKLARRALKACETVLKGSHLKIERFEIIILVFGKKLWICGIWRGRKLEILGIVKVLIFCLKKRILKKTSNKK